VSGITTFSVDQDNNLVAVITGVFKEELIPVVEYIAIHNRLSVAFKDYLVRIYNRSGYQFERTIEGLEYSSIQIDADSIQIFLSETKTFKT